ncbi:MAG: S41 family peptidase [Pseudomonadota bacterium]
MMTSRTIHRLFTAIASLCVALVAGCGANLPGTDDDNDGISADPSDCSATGQNQFVLDVMRDIYFWQSELPEVDVTAFDSPEALLDALLFTPLDRFTFINDAAADDAFFSDSQFIGVGMGVSVRDGDTLRVTQTFSDGPAAAAGIDRGYTLLSINGMTATEIINGNGISAAFGADEVGVQVDLEYADLAGTEMQATLFKDFVTIETITTTAVFDVGGRRVGYLALRNFVEPTRAALDAAFADFAAEGVVDVILDVRYNGGGLVTVAEQLGNLLGGTTTSGSVLAERTHNANNAFRNTTTVFEDAANAIDITRLVVIATGATASASELVANAFLPFVDVTWVGADTFGKPVGSYGFEFCGKVVHPTAFQVVNADGEGDYFDGFKVDCPAPDDLEHALGDPLEASLAEALNVLGTGGCSATAAAAGAGRSAGIARQAPAELSLRGRRLTIGAW